MGRHHGATVVVAGRAGAGTVLAPPAHDNFSQSVERARIVALAVGGASATNASG